MERKLIILTEGAKHPTTAKTAVNVIRYRPEQVVAVLDSNNRGRFAAEVLDVGPNVPIVGSLDEAPEANTLLIGIAPSGGKLPPNMRAVVLAAIARGMTIESGLHEFLSDDPELSAAAQKHGVTLRDVRKNDERDVATGEGFDPNCLRIHTVGHDCSVGKMVVSVELARALEAAGEDAKFVATGQTGILVEGDGCPVDRVICDFLNGAAEKLVHKNQHHKIIVVEGQGTLVHPRYSAVTLGLLHGCRPDGLIMCYEPNRTTLYGMESEPIRPLEEHFEIYSRMANLMHPAKFIGIAMNTRTLNAEEAAKYREEARAKFGLPVCDVLRDGPQELVDAVVRLKTELGK